jgi:hypothetical protein
LDVLATFVLAFRCREAAVVSGKETPLEPFLLSERDGVPAAPMDWRDKVPADLTGEEDKILVDPMGETDKVLAGENKALVELSDEEEKILAESTDTILDCSAC